MLIVPKLNPNTPTLMDGEVRLFKRKHSKVWQIAFTLDGRQVRVSSKKRILNDAVAAAREIYLDYRFRQKNGLPVISKRFADVAALCRATEPPHLNWSTAMFRKRRTENGEQATEAGRDCLEVTAS